MQNETRPLSVTKAYDYVTKKIDYLESPKSNINYFKRHEPYLKENARQSLNIDKQEQGLETLKVVRNSINALRALIRLKVSTAFNGKPLEHKKVKDKIPEDVALEILEKGEDSPLVQKFLNDLLEKDELILLC